MCAGDTHSLYFENKIIKMYAKKVIIIKKKEVYAT
jgi:hypothetical protein